MSAPEINNYTPDKRQTPRNRFRWVRRLMQGQNRVVTHTNSPGQHQGTTTLPNTHTAHNVETQSVNKTQRSVMVSSTTEDNHRINSADEDNEVNSELTMPDLTSTDDRSLEALSDQVSDNISTIPLKSIISSQSTKSPSILSDNQPDQTSLIASTAETSLAPSTHTNYIFAPTNLASGPPSATIPGNNYLVASPLGHDRDSESIVTLASSSRRIRRRSIDTNCSTTGIPPASIMERLSVQPTVGNSSTYATSVRTGDRTSQFEPSQHYDDQSSSVRSFN